MSELWASFLTTRIGRWIVGIGAVIAAIAAAVLVAFVKGKHSQADTDKAKEAGAAQQAAQEAATAVQHSADAVRATNDEISKMPDAGTQRVGDATAGPTDWLRTHADRDQASS
jgi:gas vesicle protein